MGSEVITLLIGEQPHAVPYTVHKNLLRDCGGIFKEMCDNTAPGATVALKTENPEVFKLFIDYIYSDKAPGEYSAFHVAYCNVPKAFSDL